MEQKVDTFSKLERLTGNFSDMAIFVNRLQFELDI